MMSRNKMILSLAIALQAFGIRAGVVRADFVPISTPTPTYLANTARINITPPDLTTITSLSDGFLTVSFSSPLQVRTTPTTWASWAPPPASESATPRVLFTGNPFPNTGIDLTLSRPVYTFGVELEPNVGTFPLVASFFNGAALVGSISLSASSAAGSRLFAATTTEQFTRVNLTAPAGSAGFAIAQVRYLIPEPGGLTLFALGSLGLIAWRGWESRRDKKGGLSRGETDLGLGNTR